MRAKKKLTHGHKNEYSEWCWFCLWEKIKQLEDEINDLKRIRQGMAECIVSQEKELELLRKTIYSMMSAAGIPDAQEACRTVIEWGKEGLARK